MRCSLHPSRLAEIAEILATGLMRLRARQSTPLSAHHRESSLDCLGHQSGHADPGSIGDFDRIGLQHIEARSAAK